MDRQAYDAHRQLRASLRHPIPLYPLPPKFAVPRWPLLVATFAAASVWLVVLGEAVS